MPVTFEVTVSKADVERAMQRLDPVDLNRRLHGAMQESVAMLRTLVVANTPVDRGPLSEGIFTEVNGRGMDVWGRVAPSPATKEYAGVMEWGRTPGATMPPVDVIEQWVTRKGIATGPDAHQVAFLIARSIGRHGTKAHHMFQTAARVGAPLVNQIFSRWLSRG